MKSIKFEKRYFLLQIPLVLMLLGKYLDSYLYFCNTFIDIAFVIGSIVWILLLGSYYLGAKKTKKVISQFMILLLIVGIYTFPIIFPKTIFKHLYLRDDRSSVEIILYANGSFKSQVNISFGFYRNWRGKYRIKDDVIIFSNPYYNAGGDNLNLFKRKNEQKWVREQSHIEGAVSNFQYFVELTSGY